MGEHNGWLVALGAVSQEDDHWLLTGNTSSVSGSPRSLVSGLTGDTGQPSKHSSTCTYAKDMHGKSFLVAKTNN